MSQESQESQEGLRHYLELRVLVHRLSREAENMDPPRPWPKYLNLEDFVLQHGRAYPFRPLPKGIKAGTPRRCFQDATGHALDHPRKVLYVEGFAFPAAGIFPVNHAWLIDRTGQVIDRTWTNLHPQGGEYFGVAFRTKHLRKVIKTTGLLGMLDRWEENWPLFTGRWNLSEAIYTPEELAEHWMPPATEKEG